jgi:hypothetical protein
MPHNANTAGSSSGSAVDRIVRRTTCRPKKPANHERDSDRHRDLEVGDSSYDNERSDRREIGAGEQGYRCVVGCASVSLSRARTDRSAVIDRARDTSIAARLRSSTSSIGFRATHDRSSARERRGLVG